MKAVIVKAFGSPDTFELAEVPDPQTTAGKVRIATHAVGLNYVDVLVATGKYQVKPPLPFIPGSEMAGVIEAVGAGVSASMIGKRVMVMGAGNALTDTAVVAVAEAASIPDTMSFEEAAVVQGSYTTALYSLVYRGALKRGETVLVLGAGGGVGIAAVQVAKAHGAFVIAAASTEDKRQLALSSGANVAVDSGAQDWRAELRNVAGGRAIDVIVDPVAGTLLEPSFRSLGWGGRHLMIGFASGGIPALPVNLPLLKGASLVGVDLRQGLEKTPGLQAELRSGILKLYEQGYIRPMIAHVAAMEDFVGAMELVASGHSVGRVVVRTRP